jgi:hypothetical protein
MTALQKQMVSLRMEINLLEAVLHCIDNMMANHTINTDRLFRKALGAQSHIGWTAMLHGYWSRE